MGLGEGGEMKGNKEWGRRKGGVNETGKKNLILMGFEFATYKYPFFFLVVFLPMITTERGVFKWDSAKIFI